jgi:hypothetical protein
LLDARVKRRHQTFTGHTSTQLNRVTDRTTDQIVQTALMTLQHFRSSRGRVQGQTVRLTVAFGVEMIAVSTASAVFKSATLLSVVKIFALLVITIARIGRQTASADAFELVLASS